VTHPLLSIFFIYNRIYSRGMRFFDLYTSIKITLVFSLLPYFLTDNEDFAVIKSRRSVADINKSAGELAVAFTKVN
jgi:hypothetical protein